MVPANDPWVDYRALVRRGYDSCAEAYGESRMSEPGLEVGALLDRLGERGAVLDIGCGTGVPVAQSLAHRFSVTGVDISPEMVQQARRDVPTCEFICADIMSVVFPPSIFDAVVAIYSIFHLPREQHSVLFRRVQCWLKPGGYFLCTLSHRSEPGYTEDDFFGVTMYWSNYGLAEYVEILTEVGFMLLATSTTGSGYQKMPQETNEDHPLVLARKL
jgi:SAM-dependent methyltransferase